MNWNLLGFIIWTTACVVTIVRALAGTPILAIEPIVTYGILAYLSLMNASTFKEKNDNV